MPFRDTFQPGKKDKRMFPQPLLAPELGIWFGRLSSSISPAQRSPRRCPCLVLSFGDTFALWTIWERTWRGGAWQQLHSTTQAFQREEKGGKPAPANALTELRVTHTSGCHPHLGMSPTPQGVTSHTGQPLGAAGTPGM